MAFADATLKEITDAYAACYNLQRALQEYNDGNPAPAVYRNRFTDAEIKALVDAAVDALDALDAKVNP